MWPPRALTRGWRVVDARPLLTRCSVWPPLYEVISKSPVRHDMTMAPSWLHTHICAPDQDRDRCLGWLNMTDRSFGYYLVLPRSLQTNLGSILHETTWDHAKFWKYVIPLFLRLILTCSKWLCQSHDNLVCNGFQQNLLEFTNSWSTADFQKWVTWPDDHTSVFKRVVPKGVTTRLV